jgi:hypothetical protein
MVGITGFYVYASGRRRVAAWRIGGHSFHPAACATNLIAAYARIDCANNHFFLKKSRYWRIFQANPHL